MTKDVIVSISGLQMPAEGDAEPVEVITVGDYYQKNGKHYVLYEEVNEGFEGSTKNIIKMQENCIDITKKEFPMYTWSLKRTGKICLIMERHLEIFWLELMQRILKWKRQNIVLMCR